MLVSLSGQLGALPARIQDSFSGKYSLSLPNVAKTLNKIAIPAIVVLALSNIPGVVAPGVMYLGCMSICTGFCTVGTGGAAAPACIAACAAACGPTVPISIIL